MAILQDASGTWLVCEHTGDLFLSSYDGVSKEIEVSFPSASETDYEFTRRLVDTPDVVPHDVAIQVLSPCESLYSFQDEKMARLTSSETRSRRPHQEDCRVC